jgi:hypothetical protein
MPQMNERQREILEREVLLHRERVEKLSASLADVEENLGQVVDAPMSVQAEAGALRREIRGRMAAIALGAAVLEADAIPG